MKKELTLCKVHLIVVEKKELEVNRKKKIESVKLKKKRRLEGT